MCCIAARRLPPRTVREPTRCQAPNQNRRHELPQAPSARHTRSCTTECQPSYDKMVFMNAGEASCRWPHGGRDLSGDYLDAWHAASLAQSGGPLNTCDTRCHLLSKRADNSVRCLYLVRPSVVRCVAKAALTWFDGACCVHTHTRCSRRPCALLRCQGYIR